MSSAKQKILENERWPHVKRNWIKAIKAIRNGGVFEKGYIWWNIQADKRLCGATSFEPTTKVSSSTTGLCKASGLPGFRKAHRLTA